MLSGHEAHAGFLGRAARAGVTLITPGDVELQPSGTQVASAGSALAAALASPAEAAALVERWLRGGEAEAWAGVELQAVAAEPSLDEFEGMD